MPAYRAGGGKASQSWTGSRRNRSCRTVKIGSVGVQEVFFLEEIRHPNICSLVDVFGAGKVYGIVLEDCGYDLLKHPERLSLGICGCAR